MSGFEIGTGTGFRKSSMGRLELNSKSNFLAWKDKAGTENGHIPEIKEHIKNIESLYHEVLEEKGKSVAKKPGPWRITFDTNPDHCNFKCVMCECICLGHTHQLLQVLTVWVNRRIPTPPPPTTSVFYSY